jgi:hypothetical protein
MNLSYYIDRIEKLLPKIKSKPVRAKLSEYYNSLFEPESPNYQAGDQGLVRKLFFVHNEILKVIDTQI